VRVPRLDPDWQMTLSFFVAVTVLALLMMGIAALRMRALRLPLRPFIYLPLLSPTSFVRCRPMSALPKLLLEAVLLFAALAMSYWIYWHWLLTFQPPIFVVSYLVAIGPLVWATELLQCAVTLLWLPSGYLLPHGHQRPWLARGVADFWGRRWNVYFGDWFRFVIFQPLRRRPALAVIVVFFVSGVMHELVVNGALYIVTGRAPFGFMMVYFLLQGVGVLVERRFLKCHSVLRVIFVWLVVFAPAPLMVNEGLLRTLHFWPG
jgi:hypothetical protein